MSNAIEELTSKAMGTLNAVKAGMHGLRGVFLHLSQEHGEVAALMTRVSKSTDAKVRREHFPQIRAELLSHEKGELAEVFAVMANYESLRSVVLKHNGEAYSLEKAIADVDAQDYASPEWGASFDHLFSLVKAHVAEEEGEFFPAAQKLIDEDESKAILERYEAAKKSVKAGI